MQEAAKVRYLEAQIADLQKREQAAASEARDWERNEQEVRQDVDHHLFQEDQARKTAPAQVGSGGPERPAAAPQTC